MENEKICGRYTHYKGKPYEVYGVAYDDDENKFVLYRQCYGDGAFWIRPYEMFFESTQVDGKRVRRFAPDDALTPSEAYLSKISCSLRVRHSETEQEFSVVRIDHKRGCVWVRV